MSRDVLNRLKTDGEVKTCDPNPLPITINYLPYTTIVKKFRADIFLAC